LLFAFGLLLGVSVSMTINYYSVTDPTAVRQAFGATALTVAGLGSAGYAIRKDLSYLYRLAFFLLLGLIVAGIVLIFVRIPAAYTVYALAGLAIFGLYTVIDFNRLRRAGNEEAIPLAASIFLDVFNIFLFFLTLFGGGGRSS
jgi:modulator of FtsH protease